MCNAGLALQAGGAATSTIGSFYSAAGRKVALQSQAYTDELNARLATDKGRLARQQGEAAIVARRMETGRNRADLRVTSAAGGVDVGEGTAANAVASNDIIGEIDAMTIDANAIREQGNANLEAANYNSSARTARMAASAISPFAEALITLTGETSKIASRYADWGSSGKSSSKSSSKSGGEGQTIKFNDAPFKVPDLKIPRFAAPRVR